MIPNPSDAQVSGIRRTQVTETQSSSLLLQVAVLRARHLPRLETLLGRRTKFYVTVTYGATTRQTRSVRREEGHVEWNENVDAFAIHPHSHIVVSLYAKRTARKDALIGRQEIACAPHPELDIVFGSVDGHPRHPTETVLTITVSANASSPLTVTVNTPNPPVDNLVTKGATCPIDKPTESGTPEPPIAGSQTEKSRTTLHRAEKAIDSINTIKTWTYARCMFTWNKDALGRVC